MYVLFKGRREQLNNMKEMKRVHPAVDDSDVL